MGFVDFRKPLLGVGLFTDIRVKLARLFAIGLFDLLLVGIGCHAKNLVVVFKFHR